jgi:hypothetical protein
MTTLTEAFLDYCTIHGKPPVKVVFDIFCLEENLQPDEQDLVEQKLYELNYLTCEALACEKSKSSVIQLLLTKDHGYETKINTPTPPPIAINFGTPPEPKLESTGMRLFEVMKDEYEKSKLEENQP